MFVTIERLEAERFENAKASFQGPTRLQRLWRWFGPRVCGLLEWPG